MTKLSRRAFIQRATKLMAALPIVAKVGLTEKLEWVESEEEECANCLDQTQAYEKWGREMMLSCIDGMQESGYIFWQSNDYWTVQLHGEEQIK